MSHIRIEDLNFKYSDGTQALSQVNLDLERGSRVALVGPNGAGKTTLLLGLSGLINFQGIIKIDGQIMSPETEAHLRKKMSYVFQNPDEMLFMPTVIEDVCFGLDTLGLNPQEVMDRALDALEKVSLKGFEQRSAHHLSYGERRRVCLAACLARQAALTIFDEPTRELDPHGRRNFINQFHAIEGTLILATHDLELVLETCKHMVLLDGGKVIRWGDPRELLSDATLMETHHLEVPHSLLKHPHAHNTSD